MSEKSVTIPLFQVDAFAEKVFQGNPAAVCILEEKDDFSDSFLQNIAQEMNLSETAFVYSKDLENIQEQSKFKLRWFTPNKEVKMCGHATLASAAVLFNELHIFSNTIEFNTLSGNLVVSKQDNGLCMDFPVSSTIKVQDNLDQLTMALGVENVINIEYCKSLEYCLIEVESDTIVESLSPDFQTMLKVDLPMKIGLVIVTAKSEKRKEYDFISRCFAPWFAINEDPVTGSAHTVLYPYWRSKLNKDELKAFQASKRGGSLYLNPSTSSERVKIIGSAQIVFSGFFRVD